MNLSDQRLPAERFYWAVLDIDSLPQSLSSTRRTKQLSYLFEPKLPVPIESVHTVFTSIGSSPSSSGEPARMMACAMAHDELGAIKDAASLGPADAPPFIVADVSRINMLTDRHEPNALRSKRRKLAAITSAAMVLCTAIIMIGLERRVDGARTHVQLIQQAQMDVYDQVLPQTTSTLPPEQRLVAERRLLERTRASSMTTTSSVAPSLASLFAAWPTDLDIRTQSVMLSERSVTVSATAPNHDDAQRLANALSTSPRWEATNPQITTIREGVNIRLGLNRRDESQAGSTP